MMSYSDNVVSTMMFKMNLQTNCDSDEDYGDDNEHDD